MSTLGVDAVRNVMRVIQSVQTGSAKFAVLRQPPATLCKTMVESCDNVDCSNPFTHSSKVFFARGNHSVDQSLYEMYAHEDNVSAYLVLDDVTINLVRVKSCQIAVLYRGFAPACLIKLSALPSWVGKDDMACIPGIPDALAFLVCFSVVQTCLNSVRYGSKCWGIQRGRDSTWRAVSFLKAMNWAAASKSSGPQAVYQRAWMAFAACVARGESLVPKAVQLYAHIVVPLVRSGILAPQATDSGPSSSGRGKPVPDDQTLESEQVPETQPSGPFETLSRRHFVSRPNTSRVPQDQMFGDWCAENLANILPQGVKVMVGRKILLQYIKLVLVGLPAKLALTASRVFTLYLMGASWQMLLAAGIMDAAFVELLGVGAEGVKSLFGYTPDNQGNEETAFDLGWLTTALNAVTVFITMAASSFASGLRSLIETAAASITEFSKMLKNLSLTWGQVRDWWDSIYVSFEKWWYGEDYVYVITERASPELVNLRFFLASNEKARRTRALINKFNVLHEAYLNSLALKSKTISSALGVVYTTLKAQIASYEDGLDPNDTPPPLNVYLYGIPNIMKSSIIVKICEILGVGVEELLGELYSNDELVFKHSSSYKYDHAFINQPFWINNEPTQFKQASEQIQKLYIRIQNLASGTPELSEGSEVHKKGKKMTPYICFFDDNSGADVFVNIASFMRETEALVSRLHYILQVKVRDKYKHLFEGGVAIPPGFLEENEWDLWEFHVMKLNKQGKSWSAVPTGTVLSFQDVFSLCYQHIEDIKRFREAKTTKEADNRTLAEKLIKTKKDTRPQYRPLASSARLQARERMLDELTKKSERDDGKGKAPEADDQALGVSGEILMVRGHDGNPDMNQPYLMCVCIDDEWIYEMVKPDGSKVSVTHSDFARVCELICVLSYPHEPVIWPFGSASLNDQGSSSSECEMQVVPDSDSESDSASSSASDDDDPLEFMLTQSKSIFSSVGAKASWFLGKTRAVFVEPDIGWVAWAQIKMHKGLSYRASCLVEQKDWEALEKLVSFHLGGIYSSDSRAAHEYYLWARIELQVVLDDSSIYAYIPTLRTWKAHADAYGTGALMDIQPTSLPNRRGLRPRSYVISGNATIAITVAVGLVGIAAFAAFYLYRSRFRKPNSQGNPVTSWDDCPSFIGRWGDSAEHVLEDIGYFEPDEGLRGQDLQDALDNDINEEGYYKDPDYKRKKKRGARRAVWSFPHAKQRANWRIPNSQNLSEFNVLTDDLSKFVERVVFDSGPQVVASLQQARNNTGLVRTPTNTANFTAVDEWRFLSIGHLFPSSCFSVGVGKPIIKYFWSGRWFETDNYHITRAKGLKSDVVLVTLTGESHALLGATNIVSKFKSCPLGTPVAAVGHCLDPKSDPGFEKHLSEGVSAGHVFKHVTSGINRDPESCLCFATYDNFAGMCGSLVVRRDKSKTVHFVGLHNVGFSTRSEDDEFTTSEGTTIHLPTDYVSGFIPICCEEIEEMIHNSPIRAQRNTSLVDQSCPENFALVRIDKASIGGAGTTYAKTPIWEPDLGLELAVLLGRRPWDNARTKQTIRWNEDWMTYDRNFKTYADMYLASLKIPKGTPLWSIEESLVGMVLSTSGGYPYPKKRAFFDSVDGHLEPRPWFISLIKECVLKLATGGVVNTYTKWCLKDEKLPTEKVLAAKTRLIFAVCMVDFCMTQYLFGQFEAWYKNMGFRAHHTLGLRPTDFWEIEQHLKTDIDTGDEFRAGVIPMDLEGCDTSMRRGIGMSIVQSCELFYKGSKFKPVFSELGLVTTEGASRVALIDHVFHAFEVMPGFLIGDKSETKAAVGYFPSRNKSGTKLTTLINDVGVGACAKYISSQGKKIDPNFRISVIKNSDDNLMSTNNLPLLKSLLLRARQDLGVTFVPSKKQGEIEEYDSGYDYLGRIIRPPSWGGRKCGMLPVRTIYGILSFSKKNQLEQNFPSQVLMACIEAAPWGEEFYLKMVGCVAEHVQGTLPSYDSACVIFKTITGDPDLDLRDPDIGLAIEKFRCTQKWRRLEKSVVSKESRVTRIPANQGLNYKMAVVSAPDYNVDTQDITTFVDDQSVSTLTPDTGLGVMPQGTLENFNHTIASVLSRPVTVGKVAWSDTDPRGASLGSWILLEDYFASHANALSKLAGLGYMRANARVRVMVNAPLMVGRLRLFVTPQTAAETVTNDDLVFYTGCPGVEIDVGSGGTGELMIPWVNYRMWANIDQLFDGGFNSPASLDYFDHARIRLVVLSTLGGSTNTTTATVSVTITLCDVEVRQAVPPKAMPALSTEYTRHILAGRRGAAPRRKNVPKDQGLGNVLAKTESAAFSTVDGVAKAVTDVTGTVASVAALSCGASVPPAYVSQIPVAELGAQRELMHTVGPVISINMGLSDVDRLHPGATRGDPSFHSITKFASHEALLSAFEFGDTATPNHILWSLPITPSVLYYRLGNPGTPANFASTPLSYAALMFRYYRGSLKLRLSAVKNPFFSGRLRIVYIPTDEAPRSGPMTDEDQASAYNVVWDLKTGSDIEVTIPYVSALPWTKIVSRDISGLMSPSLINEGDTTVMGYLYVVVYNELVVADSITATAIDILAYISGGDDLEFNGLCMRGMPAPFNWENGTHPHPGMVPEATSNFVLVPAGETSHKKISDPLRRHRACHRVPQDQGSEETSKAAGQDTSGVYENAGVIKARMAEAHATQGLAADMAFSHRIVSFKEVCNRPMMVAEPGSASYPVSELEDANNTIIGSLRKVFAYTTGGCRIYFWDAAGETYTVTLTAYSDPDGPQRGVPLVTTADIKFYQIPWQDQFFFLPTTTGHMAYNSNMFGICGCRSVIAVQGEGKTFKYALAAADDFELFYRIGTPNIWLYNSYTVTDTPFTMYRND